MGLKLLWEHIAIETIVQIMSPVLPEDRENNHVVVAGSMK